VTGLVKRVRAELDTRCLIQGGGLGKEGCRIRLEGTPRTRVAIDFDKPGSPLGQNETRCDYLFVAESSGNPGWIVPLELKSGKVDVSRATDQLQAGAEFAERLFASNRDVEFFPVIASGSVPKAERRALQTSRVRFRQRNERIRRVTCGDRLIKALRP